MINSLVSFFSSLAPLYRDKHHFVLTFRARYYTFRIEKCTWIVLIGLIISHGSEIQRANWSGSRQDMKLELRRCKKAYTKAKDMGNQAYMWVYGKKNASELRTWKKSHFAIWQIRLVSYWTDSAAETCLRCRPQVSLQFLISQFNSRSFCSVTRRACN